MQKESPCLIHPPPTQKTPHTKNRLPSMICWHWSLPSTHETWNLTHAHPCRNHDTSTTSPQLPNAMMLFVFFCIMDLLFVLRCYVFCLDLLHLQSKKQISLMYASGSSWYVLWSLKSQLWWNLSWVHTGARWTRLWLDGQNRPGRYGMKPLLSKFWWRDKIYHPFQLVPERN